MIRNVSLATLLFVAGGASVTGQTVSPPADETAILAVVDHFMNAVSTNDFASLPKLRLEGSFNIVERPARPEGSSSPLVF